MPRKATKSWLVGAIVCFGSAGLYSFVLGRLACIAGGNCIARYNTEDKVVIGLLLAGGALCAALLVKGLVHNARGQDEDSDQL